MLQQMLTIQQQCDTVDFLFTCIVLISVRLFQYLKLLFIAYHFKIDMHNTITRVKIVRYRY